MSISRLEMLFLTRKLFPIKYIQYTHKCLHYACMCINMYVCAHTHHVTSKTGVITDVLDVMVK